MDSFAAINIHLFIYLFIPTTGRKNLAGILRDLNEKEKIEVKYLPYECRYVTQCYPFWSKQRLNLAFAPGWV
jgi:hypothetical protein